MQAPNAVTLAVPLLLCCAVCAAAYRSFRSRGKLRAFEVVAVAISSAIAFLTLSVASSYTFRSFAVAQGSSWLFAAPIAIYLVVLWALGRKFKLSPAGLVIGATVGLLPLYVTSMFAWLFSACSFGDCI